MLESQADGFIRDSSVLSSPPCGRGSDNVVAWISLILAGVFEVVWAFFLKRSDGFTRIWNTAITIATMLVSVGLLSMSMGALPLGTAYVIWAGIGAVGRFSLGFGFWGSLSARCASLLLLLSLSA